MKAVIAKLKRVPVRLIRHSNELNDASQRALRRKRKRRVPPVLLVRSTTHYWPLDGNNRVAHARRSGKTHIWAYVITRTEYRRLRARRWSWGYGGWDDDIWVSNTKTYADLHIRT